jgi:hypothetical protein
MKDDTVVSCSSFNQDPGETIPPIAMIRDIHFGETRWILVIEKEVIAWGLESEYGTDPADSGPGNLSHLGSFPVLEGLHPR